MGSLLDLGCRLSNDQLALNLDVGCGAIAGDDFEHSFHRQSSHLPHRLANRGQQWICVRGEEEVIKTDDRNVVRHDQPSRMNCAHRPQRRHIVVAEDGSRLPIEVKQPLHCISAAFRFAVAVRYQFLKIGKIYCCESRSITYMPFRIRLKTRSVSDITDPPVTKINEMP